MHKNRCTVSARSKAWESPELMSQYEEDFPKHQCCVTIFNQCDWYFHTTVDGFVCSAASPSHFQVVCNKDTHLWAGLVGLSQVLGQRAIYSPTPPIPLLSSLRHCYLNPIVSCCLVSFTKIWWYFTASRFSMHHLFFPSFFAVLPTDEVTVNNPEHIFKTWETLELLIAIWRGSSKTPCRYIHNNIKWCDIFLWRGHILANHNFLKPSSGASNSLRAGLMIFRFYFPFVISLANHQFAWKLEDDRTPERGRRVTQVRIHSNIAKFNWSQLFIAAMHQLKTKSNTIQGSVRMYSLLFIILVFQSFRTLRHPIIVFPGYRHHHLSHTFPVVFDRTIHARVPLSNN